MANFSKHGDSEIEIKRGRRQSRIPVAASKGVPHSNLNPAETHFFFPTDPTHTIVLGNNTLI